MNTTTLTTTKNNKGEFNLLLTLPQFLSKKKQIKRTNTLSAESYKSASEKCGLAWALALPISNTTIN